MQIWYAADWSRCWRLLFISGQYFSHRANIKNIYGSVKVSNLYSSATQVTMTSQLIFKRKHAFDLCWKIHKIFTRGKSSFDLCPKLLPSLRGGAVCLQISTFTRPRRLLAIWENCQEDIAGATQLYRHSFWLFLSSSSFFIKEPLSTDWLFEDILNLGESFQVI